MAGDPPNPNRICPHDVCPVELKPRFTFEIPDYIHGFQEPPHDLTHLRRWPGMMNGLNAIER